MLRKLVGAGIALLLVVGVTLAADKKPAGKRAVGKVVSVNLKDGAGTITVMARKARGAEAEKMTFKVTKDTKFGVGAGRGKKPTPVAADKVSDTFKKDTNVFVTYEMKDDDMVATRVVKFTPRKRTDN
jgi:hypothetical protein